MGIAFPKRILRSGLGPKIVNTYPVENPSTDIGAETWNPSFAALAGLNLVASRALFVGKWAGSGQNFTIAEQEEAWNDDHDQSHPTIARTSTGLYSYTFASSYLDEDGVAVSTVLTAARATAGYTAFSGTTVNEAFAWIDPANPLNVLVQTATRTLSTGVSALADLPFWLEVR
jgi:hypothetical protein